MAAEQEEAARKQRKRGRPSAKPGSFWGRLGALALVPFVFYTFYSVMEKTVQSYRANQEALILRAEIETEKRENLRLQQQIIDARTDQQIEDSARRYLNLVRPGDQAVVLAGIPAPAEPTPTPQPAVKVDVNDSMPGWLRWLLTHLDL